MAAKYTPENYAKNREYRSEKIKRVPLDMQITEYEKLKSHVTKTGESVNGFIKRAIEQQMQRDNNK